MKKTILFGAISVIFATAVNTAPAIGSVTQKKTKPQTLAQACSPSEIKTMCPAVAAGTQDIGDCSVESIDGVSEQCTRFVKRAISKKNNPNPAAKSKTTKSAKKKTYDKGADTAPANVPVVTQSNQ